ncbi:MAG: hypothetical protein WB587_11625 [Nitrososphaeraceae archaeon]|jgi:hypothetical protein
MEQNFAKASENKDARVARSRNNTKAVRGISRGRKTLFGRGKERNKAEKKLG